MKYSVRVISEPYHYFEKDHKVRSLLSEIFSNQLRGYKTYHPEGICPISEYDFFTNHIAILNQANNEVLCSYKILELNVCLKYQKPFPLYSHLGENYPIHYKVIADWLSAHPNCGYNHSWTINPQLDKSTKKELVDITFALLANFYKSRGINNTIDLNVIPFKIHLIKEWMGNTYLNLPNIKVESYGDLLCCIMVNEGLNWSPEFRLVIERYKKLWESRKEFTPSDYMDEKKKAA